MLTANVVLFGRMLRRAGLTVDPNQTRAFAQVLGLLGFDRRGDVKAAGRALFVRRREERATYDAAFDLFWRRGTVVGGASAGLPRLRQQEGPPADVSFGPEPPPGMDLTDAVDRAARLGASRGERLRTADFAELTPDEVRDAAALLAALRPKLALRPSRRRRLDRNGERLAARAMLRRSLDTGGEPLDWRWLRRTARPRPIVLVCDISGSMERYSRFLLRFAHALARSGAPVEVFVFGTRLTRITRELRVRDPDVALRRVADRVVDWSGGTRIGASLHELNRRWVRRTVRSGAIVLLVSDGWERDDPALLAREMATLQRSCHRLIWLDPLAGRPGFEPVTQGLVAALPHVDDFLPCASVASLEALGTRLGGWADRRIA
ncbi:MAG TPA: VWA domain-containing protein [Gemmatimonadales bacterium]|nr:VWA domain-containing protein [Gemmatimonadales bacterium]